MTQKPVLIIGAGPVGLSLAIALVHQGIRVEVFEALPELSGEIRASTFHPPTLEMFAEWGVLDHVLANGHTVNKLIYWERATRERIAEFDYANIAKDTLFPFRLQCPQHVLTRTLMPLLEQSPLATIHMGQRLVSFVDTGVGVEAVFEGNAGISTRTGSYLCGTDGSRSTVRKQLGLSFEGKTYEDRFLLVATDIDFTPYFPDIGPVNYLYDPREWVIILHLPDLVRIVFRMRPDEDEAIATQEENIRQRVRDFIGAELDFNIFSISVYKVHQRIADRFRVGRVLLLGDAAHINNPSGGMGMNSGIHDAHNLAPKLAAVLAGGDESLLEQYHHERYAHALENIQGESDRNYADLTASELEARRQRNMNMRTAAADPALARAYLLKASMMAERI